MKLTELKRQANIILMNEHIGEICWHDAEKKLEALIDEVVDAVEEATRLDYENCGFANQELAARFSKFRAT